MAITSAKTTKHAILIQYTEATLELQYGGNVPLAQPVKYDEK